MEALSPHWQAGTIGHVISMAWAPNGQVLAAAAADGPITILSRQGEIIASLPGHRFGTSAIAWSREGSHLASGGQDGKIIIWNPTTWKAELTLEAGSDWAEHLAWNPLGGTNGIPHILATAAGRKLRLWGIDGKLIRELEDHKTTIASLAWKPASQLLSTVSYSRLAIYGTKTSKAERQFEWKGSILKIAWSPNGKYIATGDQDATVHFWFEKTGRDLQMSGYPTKVRELSWDSTSRYLATGGGTDITVWDCLKSPEGTRPIVLRGHEMFVSALAYQHRGPLLASAGLDGRVIVWHPHNNKKPLCGIALNSPVSQLCWSPDEALIAAGTDSGGIVVFNSPQNRERK